MTTGRTRKVAVVTGAGRGLGRAIAERLHARGYLVVVTDIDPDSAQNTANELGAVALPHDVRNATAHCDVAAAASALGRLAIWVNNAGVLRTDKAWAHSEHDVELMVQTNVLGVIHGSRAAIDAMARHATGDEHIINIASISAFGPVPGLAVYAATKHAVLGFTTSLQGDLRAAGLPIRAHAICPDGADTAMLRERSGDPDAAIIFSGQRLLAPEQVAERAVELIHSDRLVVAIPRSRGVFARMLGLAPRLGLRLAPSLRRLGERHRQRHQGAMT